MKTHSSYLDEDAKIKTLFSTLFGHVLEKGEGLGLKLHCLQSSFTSRGVHCQLKSSMATSSSEENSQEWTVLLSSKRRLDREKGLTALKTLLASSNLQPEDKEKIEAHVFTLITSLVGPWEDRHGGLMATGLILESGVATSGFSRQVTSSVPLLLEETESRVRIATGMYMY